MTVLKKFIRHAAHNPSYLIKFIKKRSYAAYFMLTSPFIKLPKGTFDHVKYFVFFIGHDRSGHSAVRALLDAQPNMVVSNELDVLPLLKKYKKRKVYTLIVEHARQGMKRTHYYYDYTVPGQFQGTYKEIHVVGDKKGESSTLYLYKNKTMLKNLKKRFGKSLKIINVIRNPYDNITAIAMRRSAPLREAIDTYFLVTRAMVEIRNALPPGTVYTVYHEDLMKNKGSEIKKLCAFLGESISADALKACASMLYDSPHKRRHKIHWSEKDKRKVQENIKEYSDLLGHYRF